MNPDTLKANTLLLTPTGSHLYGMAHAGSDQDFYRITPDTYFWNAIGASPTGNRKRMARQHINNGIDEITLAFGTFARFAFDGIPQALEAMFSEQCIIDELTEFRNSFYAGTGMDSMREKYRKTIRSFAHGDFKQRRHALRLSINLEEAMQSGGRFNPTLKPEQITTITEMAASNPASFIKGLESLNRYEIASNFNMEEIAGSFAKEKE